MLTLAVSSRSLFHMETANKFFMNGGQDEFDAHMRETEADPLPPGVAFSLVRKLLNLNTKSAQKSGRRHHQDRVEVVMLSKNSPDAGMRIANSIQHHGLEIERAVFTKGGNRLQYAKAFGVDLFLCANEAEATLAIQSGIAAAIITPGAAEQFEGDGTVRIVFDGDSVLFSDEADLVFREHGLEEFTRTESAKASTPLPAGPFKRLLEKLHDLRSDLTASDAGEGKRGIHIGLVTARGMPAHGRVINTLRSWGLPVDEAVFAGGAPKGPLLDAMGADFFFDDTGRHIESAALSNVAAARVPFGAGGIGAVANKVEALAGH